MRACENINAIVCECVCVRSVQVLNQVYLHVSSSMSVCLCLRFCLCLWVSECVFVCLCVRRGEEVHNCNTLEISNLPRV